MTKVKVTLEVATAITELRDIGIHDFEIIRNVGVRQGFGSSGLNPHLKVLDEWRRGKYGGNDELVRALAVGYDVEKSPEESLRQYYEGNTQAYATTQFTSNLFEGRRQGVRKTLDILGIKIGGINA